MFTVCPSCKLNLALTANDLRVGQGYVRCGRCEMVFNSLLALHEEAAPSPVDDAPLSANTAPRTPDPVPREPEQEPHDTGPHNALSDEWAQRQRQSVIDLDLVETTGTGTFETIVLEGDGFLQTEEHVDELAVDVRIQAIADQIEASEQRRARPAARQPVDAATIAPLSLAPEPLQALQSEPDAASETTFEVELLERPKFPWLWATAIGLLALLLVVQVVHRHRHSLVTKAFLEKPMRSIYSALGSSLEPNWDLKAYDVRQLGGEAMSGNSTSIMLRASVHNRATIAQPPPMIRAVLQDRFGNALSTTDIAPQDYLRTSPSARMQPDQRLDAELVLEDPNRQAVGFELDACLPTKNGKLHCSHAR
jgi:predicted Zn finger-like uncharacterized protein